MHAPDLPRGLELGWAVVELQAYCYDVDTEGMVRSDLWALWWD